MNKIYQPGLFIIKKTQWIPIKIWRISDSNRDGRVSLPSDISDSNRDDRVSLPSDPL